MMTMAIDSINQHATYQWMLNNESLLCTSKKTLSYDDCEKIAKDFQKNMKWIALENPNLTEQNALYYTAWDWSITVATIKQIVRKF